MSAGRAIELERRSEFRRLKEEIMEGATPLPTKATLELTLRCNLSCQMCFRDRGSRDELTLKEVRDIVEGLPESTGEIRLIGGEIFLRQDIFDILDLLSERGLKVRMTTNGTLLTEERVGQLRGYNNILSIGLSIDGPRELHNRIRGSEAAFDQTVEAIRMLSPYQPVSVNTVIMEENIGSIPHVFSLIRELGIGEYRLEPEMFCTPEEVRAAGDLPIAANIKEGGGYGYHADELRGLKERIDGLAGERGIRVSLIPKVAELYPEEFLGGRIREGRTLFCKHLLIPRINTEGSLVYCHIIRKTFGSLKKRGFEELWNNGDMAGFRKMLLTNNLLSVCKRCCRLRSI